MNEDKMIPESAFQPLRHSLDSITDSVFWIDRHARLVYANRAVSSNLGYSREELLEMTVFDIDPQFDPAKWQEHWQEILTRNSFVIETEHRTKDGRSISVEVTVNCVEWNGEKYNCAIARDISERKRAEAEIEKTRVVLKSIIDSTADFIWAVDSETYGLLSWNRAVQDHFRQEYGIHVRAGMSLEELHPEKEEWIRFWQTSYRRVLQEGPYEQEYRISTGTRILNLNFRLLARDDRIFGISVFGKDITDHNDALEQQGRLARVVEESRNEIYIFDAENLRFVQVNRSARRNLGYSMEELRFLTPLDIKPEHTVESFARLVAPLRQERQAAVEFATNHQRKDGSLYPVEVHLQLLKGTPSFFAAIILDLTERKRAEESLRESEQKLSALFASMTEMVVLHELLFDAHGRAVDYRITDCNRAFTQITGMPRESVLGRKATDLYASAEPPYLETYSRVAVTGEPHAFETYYAAMEKHFFISVVSPGKNRFATITADITAIKQAEKMLAAKNKELEQIVYVASHDLRSPLVNVDGFSKEIEYSVEEIQKALDCRSENPNGIDPVLQKELPEIGSALGHIRKSTRQMDALLKGLLKLSRCGRAALRFQIVDMNDLVAGVASSVEFQSRKSGADLQIGDLPPCWGDSVQVTQVFANLLGNAFKFLTPGRPGAIRIHGRIEQGRSVYCVEDNGIGILREHQEKIFELFHRLNPSKTDGEGLGLTIVHQILNRLDGEIRVDSTPGVGSRFYVSLPCPRPGTGGETKESEP